MYASDECLSNRNFLPLVFSLTPVIIAEIEYNYKSNYDLAKRRDNVPKVDTD